MIAPVNWYIAPFHYHQAYLLDRVEPITYYIKFVLKMQSILFIIFFVS